jgi:hypothetical protein
MNNQNNINDIRTSSNYQIRSKTKMKPFNFNIDPENIARIFSLYVRAIVQILFWATIGFAAIAAAYVALSGIWIGAKFALKTIGF